MWKHKKNIITEKRVLKVKYNYKLKNGFYKLRFAEIRFFFIFKNLESTICGSIIIKYFFFFIILSIGRNSFNYQLSNVASNCCCCSWPTWRTCSSPTPAAAAVEAGDAQPASAFRLPVEHLSAGRPVGKFPCHPPTTTFSLHLLHPRPVRVPAPPVAVFCKKIDCGVTFPQLL
jgi:hypothetical protein